MIKKANTKEESAFIKLKRIYFIALSAVAISLLIGQGVIRNFINNQEGDSSVINVAGRQRMLSQKLTKEVLFLSQEKDVATKIKLKDELKKTIELLESSHNNLINRDDTLSISGDNSSKVVSMYTSITPYYKSILDASKLVVSSIESELPLSKFSMDKTLYKIKHNEGPFLKAMDGIVNQYNKEARIKVNRLRNLETWIVIVTLSILLAELLFLFLPSAKFVQATIQKLTDSEENSTINAEHAYKLKEENEKSVKEIRKLNDVIDRTLLFARVHSDGTIIYFGEKFSRLFKVSRFQKRLSFAEVLSIDTGEQEIIKNILESNKQLGWSGEVKVTSKSKENMWLEMSVVPFSDINDEQEYIVISSDITKRKKAQNQIEKLSSERYAEKMNQQKVITRQLIENQEKEQNRIAKDIHDGIGQMLTGLKFNLESINPQDIDITTKKIEYLKELASNIIKGVRTATFNLTPPELGDFGIIPALSKLTKELSNYSNMEVEFFNKSNFQERLSSVMEINLYRIVQEAINNAIKYSKATHVVVTLSHSSNLLSITIDDNGVGFDMDKKHEKTSSGGMGLTFMQERIKYIDGRLFINSESNKGTRISLNAPIDVLEHVV